MSRPKKKPLSGNDILYGAAVEAMDKLYSDTSVSLEVAVENMTGLRDECNQRIDVLRNDIKNRDRGGK